MPTEVSRRETTGDCGTISYKEDGGSFTPFAKVVDITPNKITVPKVDTTLLNSRATRSQASRTPDYGEVAVTILVTAENSALILSWIKAAKTNIFQVTMDDYEWEGGGDNSAVEFAGWVQDFPPLGNKLEKDKAVEATLTIKIDGEVELTPGTAA
ncbi:MAG: hypothetical protein FWD61_03345 [Phycisphaerales bacterium]|nr:hypothetical protein [Phycisphaerales bacterium]